MGDYYFTPSWLISIELFQDSFMYYFFLKLYSYIPVIPDIFLLPLLIIFDISVRYCIILFSLFILCTVLTTSAGLNTELAPIGSPHFDILLSFIIIIITMVCLIEHPKQGKISITVEKKKKQVPLNM